MTTDKPELQSATDLPTIIQGGMGIGASHWKLANATSRNGALGIVSAVALDNILVRRLQLGDEDGDVRRALAHFPWPEMAKRVEDKYFIEGGKEKDAPFAVLPLVKADMSRTSAELLIIATFVEVFLAKEGHNGAVGINFLYKIPLYIIPSILGAMLANVDAVIVGAGVPLSIPGTLDGLAEWKPVDRSLSVDEAAASVVYKQYFDPSIFCYEDERPKLKRPFFLAIISSEIIAKTMMRRANGEVDGFIVEKYVAGGHNAPPRKERGAAPDAKPYYGEKDDPDITRIQNVGKPFWIAGGYASPEKLLEAQEEGAQGIQVGTMFAMCDDSGFLPEIRQELLDKYDAGTLVVTTDFDASPTGYPFKAIVLDTIDTISSKEVYEKRSRICDLGYLREFYPISDTEIGYRCSSEPVKNFVRKGGEESRSFGKQCLCNGLLATVGLGQVQKTGVEPPMITAGDDFSFLDRIKRDETGHYTAKDAINYLLGR